MRYTLTLLALLLCNATIHAQQWRPWAQVFSYESFHNGKTQRYVDSTVYGYTPATQRGSTYDNAYIGYDVADSYQWYEDDSVKQHYSKTTRNYKANDSNVNKEIRYYNEKINGIDTFRNGDKDSFDYDAAGRMVFHQTYYIKDYKYPYYLLEYSRLYYTYDANGLLTEYYGTYTPYNNPNYYPSEKNRYTYDSANRLVVDSALKYEYVTASWRFVADTQYVYDTAGYLSRIESYTNVGDTAYVLSDRKYFYHNAQGQLIMDSMQTRYQPPYYGIRTQKEHRYAYNAKGLITADSLYTYKDTTPRTLAGYTLYRYTSFDYLESVTLYSSNNSVFNDWRNTKYYYKMFFPLSATSKATNADRFDAYPVPAGNFVNIKWHTDKPVHVKGSIINMQGQVVQQWSDDVNGTYLKSVNVTNMPTGNYTVILQADGLLMQQRIAVLK